MPTTDDRLSVIGIGATVVLAIIGGSCSTNARIDDFRADMNARFAEVNARFAEVNARFGNTKARIADLNAEVRAEHAEIRIEIRRIDDRLRVVERAVDSDQPAQ